MLDFVLGLVGVEELHFLQEHLENSVVFLVHMLQDSSLTCWNPCRRGPNKGPEIPVLETRNQCLKLILHHLPKESPL